MTIKKKIKRKSKASKKIASKKAKKNKAIQQGKNILPSSKNQNHPGKDKNNRWLPGFCPNKGGRPKGSLSLTGILRKILSEPKTAKSKMTKGEDLMKVLLKHAKEGNPKLLDIILTRLDGKVPDRLITTDTGPLEDIDEDKLNAIINAGRNEPNPQEDSGEPSDPK